MARQSETDGAELPPVSYDLFKCIENHGITFEAHYLSFREGVISVWVSVFRGFIRRSALGKDLWFCLMRLESYTSLLSQDDERPVS
jgi:hypothetical protein